MTMTMTMTIDEALRCVDKVRAMIWYGCTNAEDAQKLADVQQLLETLRPAEPGPAFRVGDRVRLCATGPMYTVTEVRTVSSESACGRSSRHLYRLAESRRPLHWFREDCFEHADPIPDFAPAHHWED